MNARQAERLICEWAHDVDCPFLYSQIEMGCGKHCKHCLFDDNESLMNLLKSKGTWEDMAEYISAKAYDDAGFAATIAKLDLFKIAVAEAIERKVIL